MSCTLVANRIPHRSRDGPDGGDSLVPPPHYEPSSPRYSTDGCALRAADSPPSSLLARTGAEERCTDQRPLSLPPPPPPVAEKVLI